jgi:hypothetical protein
MIDATVESITPTADARPAIGDAYAGQADWDPRQGEGFVFVVLEPVRMQAWREADEIPGRTIMRRGAWVNE